MPSGENEVIAADPARLVGIVPQRVTVKDGAHFRAAQRKPQMSRLRRLHRIHAQPARLVSRARKNFKIQAHPAFISRSIKNWNLWFLLLLTFGKRLSEASAIRKLR